MGPAPVRVDMTQPPGSRLGLLVLLLVLLGNVVSPQPAAGEDRPDPATGLAVDSARTGVEQGLLELRSSRRSDRVRGERRLRELGTPALVWLPADDELESASVRDAVGRVRTELETRLAAAATLASTLRLSGERSVADWAVEIARQTGNRVLVSDLPAGEQQRRLRFDRPADDFWPEFQHFADTCGVDWRLDGEAGALRLVPRPEGAARESAPTLAHTHRGIHRIAVDRAVWRVREGQRPLLRLNLSIVAEPRVRHLLFQVANAKQHLTVPEGMGSAVEFTPFSPEGQLELPPAGGQARLQLDWVLRAGEEVARLRLAGEFSATVAPLNLPVRFRGLNALTEKSEFPRIRRRRGGVQVELEEVRLRPETGDTQSAEIRIAVAYSKGGPAFESHRTWIVHNEAFLEAESGQRTPREAASEPTFQADGAVGMSYRFKGLPKPWREDTFVYSAPALIVDLPVRFDLEFSAPAAVPSTNLKATP